MTIKEKQTTLDILAYAAIAGTVLIAAVGWRGAVAPPTLNFSNPITERTAAVTATAPDENKVQLGLRHNVISDLDRTINTFAAAQPNEVGVFLQLLDDDTTLSAGADTQMTAASLYKPFVAVKALQMVEAGKLNLQTIVLDGMSLQTCIEKTIEVSDNPCGLALLKLTGLGSNQGLSALRADGYADTDLRGEYPQTTARDVAKLFEGIYTGQLLNENHTALLMSSLLKQQVNDRLPAGAPDDVRLAHKTGDLEGVSHDAGIALSPRGDYIIVVMSGIDPSRTLPERYDSFSRLMSDLEIQMQRLSAPGVAVR